MDDLRETAFALVLRACSFASLGIFCLMVGFSFNPRLAFQIGGTLTLLMVLILVLKAFESQTKDYRRTELWLNLPDERRPPKAYAQRASATVLRETYLLFASWTAAVSIVMWSLALLFSFASG